MNRKHLGLLVALFAGFALASSAATARAEGTGAIEGLVRDARGRLLSGVRVRLALGNLSATVRTDSDGTYSIDGLEAASGYSLRAKARRYKTSEQSGVTVAAGGHTRVDFALIPLRGSGHGAIQGVVADASGQPIRGARVDVLDGATDGHATTGRNGGFRLKGLAPGAYSLTAASAGFTTGIVAGLQVRDGNPTEVQVDLALAEEGEPCLLFGRVRDEAGHPVIGAQVEIVTGPSEGSAVTGDEGAYEMGSLAPGTYSVRAGAEGFWGNTWDGIQLAAGHHVRVDFALHRQEQHDFGAIVGRVRDREGHAIAGVTVEVIEGATHKSTLTDAKGIYRLSDLLPGGYLLQASKDGFKASRGDTQVKAGHTSELHFVLEREQAEPGAIVGHVRDHEGHAIVGATVEVVEGPTHRSAQTDGKGVYRLNELAAGGYLLQASKDGFQSRREDIQVQAGHTSELHFVLEREHVAQGAIAGRVKDHEGHVIVGATVEVVDGPTRRSTQTDAKGFYRLGDLLVGEYVIEARKDGFNSTRKEARVLDGKTTELHFVLEREHVAQGAIAGRVKDHEGHVIVEATVEVVDGPTRRSTQTDAKGFYRLGDLVVGGYVIEARSDGFHSARREVQVLDGKTAEVHFILESEQAGQGALIGQVRDGEGHAIVGATVEIVEGPHVVTNAKGVYELAQVAVGVYTVRARKDGFHAQVFEHVTITADDTTTQNFTLTHETANASKRTRHRPRGRRK